MILIFDKSSGYTMQQFVAHATALLNMSPRTYRKNYASWYISDEVVCRMSVVKNGEDELQVNVSFPEDRAFIVPVLKAWGAREGESSI